MLASRAPISERVAIEQEPVLRMRATESAQSSWQSCAASSTALAETVVASSASAVRSEEHTSELQSHLNLVCRLLLEKKNIKTRDDPRAEGGLCWHLGSSGQVDTRRDRNTYGHCSNVDYTESDRG